MMNINNAFGNRENFGNSRRIAGVCRGLIRSLLSLLSYCMIFANDCLTRRLNIRYLCDCIGIFNVEICLEDVLMTEIVMTVRPLCFFVCFCVADNLCS